VNVQKDVFITSVLVTSHLAILVDAQQTTLDLFVLYFFVWISGLVVQPADLNISPQRLDAS